MGNDLFITITATGEVLKAQGHFVGAGFGIEQLIFGDGTTWNAMQIQQAAVITGTSGADTLNGTNANETLTGLEGNDTISASGGNDTLYGGDDNDTLSGGDGNDTLYGGAGIDTLDGGVGNDTFTGGLGNDTLRSGTGSDHFFYASADGSDLLDDESGSLTDVDVLTLSDLNPADVMLTKAGAHLYIDIIATGYRLTLEDHFWSTTANWGIEQIVFANQTVWDRASIAANAAIRGTSGNDTLNGTGGTDLFVGGLGNDTIRSGAGNDTHIYASGDGNDLIDEESGSTSEVDVLKFTDINASDIALTKSGVHLVVTVTATGHQITLDEQYWNAGQHWGIDQFTFANATTWNRDQIMQNAWWNGTTGNDWMNGWSSFDQINGGVGDDTINGHDGIDTLVGGAGNDTLSGGAGNDKFVFQTGFGQDTINDLTVGAASDDVIEFRDGIFVDYAAVLAGSQQIGADVKITVDASNTILLKNVTLASLHQDDFLFV